MLLIFDTSVIIALEKRDKNILKRVSELSRIYFGSPQTTFISYFEFLQGVIKRSPKNQVKAIGFLRNFNCLSATERTAEIMADLRERCNTEDISINLADLIIASIAKENNMVLITGDRVFERVKDIRTIIL